MKIAYLVNVYPAPSHAFIRREILALEAAGHQVVRYSIRRFIGDLADSRDQQELTRTRGLLAAGALSILSAAVATLFAHPLASRRALQATWRLARQSRRGLLAHLAYLLEAALLRKWAKRDAVEHLHAHFGTNPAAVAMLCTLLGGPAYSFTVHGPEEFDQPLALGLRDKIAGARFVVAISEFGRSQLYRWSAPERWCKIHVVRCGVDDHFLDTPSSLPAQSSRLVCVGRLCAEKGQSLLIDSLAKLRDEGIAFELSFIGDGPTRDALRRRVAHHRLESQISFRGWQSSDTIRDAVLASRALVLPSFAEGLPVVLMESLALSRPVVTTYVAGIPELVEPAINGWLVPAGSVEALTQALRNVLAASPEQLGEMGRAGAAAVRQKHDARREAAVLATLFTSTYSNAGQRP